MTAVLLPNGKQQFIDINGKPLVGGTVGMYVPNTLVKKDTWQDADQQILNTNPIILDSRGQAIIYGSGIYRQILRDSLGNLIWDELTTADGSFPSIVTPEMFGATGDGRKGSGGVSNSTTLFIDANQSWKNSDVGKIIIIAQPVFSANAVAIKTIARVNSATSINLSTAMAYSSTGLTYYYGTDDSDAIIQANAYVGSLTARTGYAANFNTYAINTFLYFQAPNIYISTKQLNIGGSQATTASAWLGLGGRPTIVFAIASASTDCLVFGANLSGGGPVNGAMIKDMVFDGMFSGRDLMSWGGFQSPIIEGVMFFRAARDAISLHVTNASFMQNSTVEDVSITYCGRNGLYVKADTGSFVNEMNFTNFVIGQVSVLGANGTAIIFDAPSAGFIDSWVFSNFKLTQNWNGDASYKPLDYPVYFTAGTKIFPAAGLTLETGYCEQGGTTINATKPPIFFAAGADGRVFVRGFYASNWGLDITRSPFDGASSFSVAAGASQDIIIGAADNVYSGTVFLSLNDGTHASVGRYSIVNASATAATVTSLGLSDIGAGAVTYTLTSTVDGSRQMHLTVNNTGAVPFTFTYAALSDSSISPCGYQY